MEKMIDRIVVCLDLSDYDLACAKQAAYWAGKLAVEEVVLLHNIRFDFLAEMPEFQEKDYASLSEKIQQRLRERFEHLFNFSGRQDKVRFKVSRDNSTVEAIRSELGDSGRSLLIMGNKKPKDGLGVMPMKLLAVDRAQNPVLFCHKKSPLPQGQMLVGTDFSKANAPLFRLAQQLSEKLENDWAALHVCKIPMSYFPYFGKENKEMERQLIEKARKRLADYVQEAELALPDFEVLAAHRIAEALAEYYRDSKANLLILNRLGKTNLTNNPLGGVVRSLLADTNKKAILVL